MRAFLSELLLLAALFALIVAFIGVIYPKLLSRKNNPPLTRRKAFFRSMGSCLVLLSIWAILVPDQDGNGPSAQQKVEAKQDAGLRKPAGQNQATQSALHSAVAPQQPEAQNDSIKTAVPSVSDPQQNDIDQQDASETPLTRKELAQAYSDYTGDLTAKIMATEMLRQIYSSKVQQALEFRDLNALKQSAADWKEAAQKEQADLDTTISQSPNIDEKSAYLFDQSHDAAMGIASSELEIAVDFATYADTGIDMTDEVTNDVKAHNQALDKYKGVILAGYKSLGVKKSEINLETLTLKQANVLNRPVPGNTE